MEELVRDFSHRLDLQHELVITLLKIIQVEDMDGGIDGSYIVFYKNQLVQTLKLFFR